MIANFNKAQAPVTRNSRGWRIGECHAKSTLTWAEVQVIRTRYASGRETYASLAAAFEVGACTIRDIVKGYTRRFA